MSAKQSKKGMVLIDALLSFVMITIIVTLLASQSVASMKTTIRISKRMEEHRALELSWWNDSNGGCRDRCLVEELLYR